MELTSLRSLVARVPVRPLPLDELERRAVTSTSIAWAVIAGLPALGFLASLYARLPLFAGLMAVCFLLATALVCRQALLRFTARTLRLLVTARLVIVLVVGALLFCATGAAWTAVASAVLLWLAADRLMGRWALTDLGDQAGCETAPASATDLDGEGPVSMNTSPDPAEARSAEPVADASSRLFAPQQDDAAGHSGRHRRKGSCKS